MSYYKLFALGTVPGDSTQLWYSDDQGISWDQIDHSAIADDDGEAEFNGCATPKTIEKVYTYANSYNVELPYSGIFAIDLTTNTWTLENDQTDDPANAGDRLIERSVKIWCSACDDLVIMSGAGYYSNKICVRAGPPGTPWAVEYMAADPPSSWEEYQEIWGVHGTSDGQSVFAIAADWDDFTNILLKRNPITKTWVEVYRTPAGFLGYGWQDLKVISDTEVYIIGLDWYGLSDDPLPQSPPAEPGTVKTDRIWKWDGNSMVSVWQPISNQPHAGTQTHLSLWMSENGNEGWALSYPYVYWTGPSNPNYPEGWWIASFMWARFSEGTWNTVKDDGYYRISSKHSIITQIPENINSSLAVSYSGSQLIRYDEGNWEDDGDQNEAYWLKLKPSVSGIDTEYDYREFTTFDYREFDEDYFCGEESPVEPPEGSFQGAYPSAIKNALGSYSPFINIPHPNTGNLIEGWKWDKTVWGDNRIDNRAFIIPSNWDPSKEGLSNTLFQSGIGSGRDLLVERIKEIPSSFGNQDVHRLWSPEIRHGYYYDYDEQGYLYSDDSEVYYPQYNEVVNTNCNIITLDDWPKPGVPVSAIRYYWNQQKGKYEIDLILRKKIHFTGIRDENNALLPTYDEDTQEIIWENVDQALNEFIITDIGGTFQAIFNKQYVEEIGESDAVADLEIVGESNGEALQQFHSAYSPLDKTKDFKIYSWIDPTDLQEWTPVEYGTELTGHQVYVDWDLGVIEFGDPKKGESVPPGGYIIGIRYWRTIRLEFEPNGSNNTILATEANINSLYRRTSRGFIYLSNQIEDAASITLKAILPEIQTNLYGPLLIGNTFAPIVATVKDSRGQLLEGQQVAFFINSIPPTGSFGSSIGNLTVTSPTDEYGEARVYYTPPRSISDISDLVKADGWSIESFPGEPYAGLDEITTLQTQGISIDGNINDIFLYKVFVDDAILGILDIDVENTTKAQLDAYYKKFFEEEEIYGPTGLEKDGSGDLSTTAVQWENAQRLAWNISCPNIFRDDAKSGRKQLVAKIDNEMLNPYTFEPPAVGPVQPIDIRHIDGTVYEVIFDTSIDKLPEPEASKSIGPTGTFYAYMIVAPTMVRLQASVYNQRLNRLILSNEITIKLAIPPYMSGLWIINAINQNHIKEISDLLANITAAGQRVPLGWRLRSSRVTLAAALDGITFINTNPKYNFDPYDPDAKINLVHQVKVTKAP